MYSEPDEGWLWVERRARERDIRVWWEMGELREVGRGKDSSSRGVEESEEVELDELRRGESGGRREIAERIWGVVVRRTIG